MRVAKKKNVIILGLSGLLAAFLGASAVPALAQSPDVSPHIVLESMPSDNPAYRRMIIVRYLRGSQVVTSYKAYNRREFINARGAPNTQAVDACANGAASSISKISAFAREEARLSAQSQPPKQAAFCIKNIPNWTERNKDRYLNPIFEGMPYLAPK